MKRIILFVTAVLLAVNGFAQAPNWEWSWRAGGSQDDAAFSVVTDASGNVYTTGYFTGPTIVFGNTTLTGAGDKDIFIVKFDSFGNLLWAKNFGGIYDDAGMSISIDSFGKVYLTGYFTSPTIAFDSCVLTKPSNSGGLFLTQLDTSGNVLWAKSAIGYSGSLQPYSISISGSGVYITGYFRSPTLSFGGITITNSDTISGSKDFFIAKYDTYGVAQWAKSAGFANNDDQGNSVATDDSGNVIVTGYYHGGGIFFGNLFISDTLQIPNEIFLVKYDSLGNELWARSISAANQNTVNRNAVCTDIYNNVIVTGVFTNFHLNIDSISLTNYGGSSSNYLGDMYLAKFNPVGNVIWARNEGTFYQENGMSVATDLNANIYVTGYFRGNSITIGGYYLSNFDSCNGCPFGNLPDYFLAKYGPSGNVDWAKCAGGSLEDYGLNVSIDNSGNVYLVGYNAGFLTFGNITYFNIGVGGGAYDMYLVKIGSSQMTVGGTEIFKNENGINIYPNPFTSQTNITFNEPQKNTTIKITDVLGKEIKTITFTGKQCVIEKGEMKAGVYFVEVYPSLSLPEGEKKPVYRKLVVQ